MESNDSVSNDPPEHARYREFMEKLSTNSLKGRELVKIVRIAKDEPDDSCSMAITIQIVKKGMKING